uniref:Cytochrome b6-f complex subunit 7 n=2 Tax=Liagora TaxID=31487 RepID=A0A1G4NZX8_9FLOR|nr:Cytochrome b6-f complex subunit 7 [Liagora harveyana]YP_009315570.1 Cytochrome b6-f complex subunit 7 [Liagora brachyclada]SCW22596.1 Cytochrome b6-f complex subunit 7 [Liagora harveyana]SCW24228.1 Cytochrome b6-f complex subunit 7 [Liagora brachyclada]
MASEIINSAVLSSTMVMIGLMLGFVLLKVQGE